MKRLLLNKRGTEKPIEIFIALFVILAVAMVLLRMFGGQISEKQKELKDLADASRLEQAQKDVRNFCNQRCSEISSQLDRVKYCMQTYPQEIDLDDNGLSTDYNTQLATLGVCEDKVYCSVLTDCNKLSMAQCKDILCTYFEKDLALESGPATERLVKTIQPGTCYEDLDEDDLENHWFTFLNTTEFRCN